MRHSEHGARGASRHRSRRGCAAVPIAAPSVRRLEPGAARLSPTISLPATVRRRRCRLVASFDVERIRDRATIRCSSARYAATVGGVRRRAARWRRAQVIASGSRGIRARPVARHGAALRDARRCGAAASSSAVRDHTAIVPLDAAGRPPPDPIVVHLSHMLVEPPHARQRASPAGCARCRSQAARALR